MTTFEIEIDDDEILTRLMKEHARTLKNLKMKRSEYTFEQYLADKLNESVRTEDERKRIDTAIVKAFRDFGPMTHRQINDIMTHDKSVL